MAQRLPLHFVCACPENYQPDTETVARTREVGFSEVEISHDPMSAVKGADIVYTDVWASVGQKVEAEQRKTDFQGFQVDDRRMEAAGKPSLFRHCLPVERGIETTDSVVESKASIVFDQAETGCTPRMVFCSNSSANRKRITGENRCHNSVCSMWSSRSSSTGICWNWFSKPPI